MDIGRYLSRREVAVANDKEMLEDWKNGRISTQKAIRLLKKNNAMPDTLEILESDFRAWARSIGYERREM